MTKEEKKIYDKNRYLEKRILILNNKKIYYKKNYEIKLSKQKEYYKEHKQEKYEYNKKYIEKNSKKIKKYNEEYKSINVDKLNKYNKKYYITNKKELNIKHKKWIKNNLKKLNYYHRKYYKEKLRLNLDYLIKSRLRKRIYDFIKTNNKSQSTLELLGCSIDELKSHFQQTAVNNGYKDFDINNYSGKDYHIDHIKPCASFDLTKPEQQKECFNWSNLQILEASKNIIKGSKYETKIKVE